MTDATSDPTPTPAPASRSGQRVLLTGSGRSPLPGARTSGPVPADARVSVTVVLRRRADLDVEGLAEPLGRAELGRRFGASEADISTVTSWAAGAGLTVDEVDPPSRRVRLSGDVGAVARAFDADVQQAQIGGLTYRQRDGHIQLAPQLADVVVAVLGLDDRPQSRSLQIVAAAADVQTSYAPPQLGAVYDFPPGTDGSGQTVAIIELGGGYADSELATYWDSIGLPAATRPTVTAVGVDGSRNQPGADPAGADGEVLLDIEVVGGLAPGADIVVYFAPNTDAGFLDAVSTATHAEPTPTAMSISWGQREEAWTAQARDAMDAAFADAAALGITVTVASGDDGSTDRAGDGGAHVDFPAASPHVLSCGGTSLQADPTTGTVTSETVWSHGAGSGASGGGVSTAFALPTWQQHAGVPPRAGSITTGRGVPDVAAVADPRTGYQVLVDGKRTVIGGTSAVAPLWAALVARLAQQLRRPLGLPAPTLYAGAARGVVAPGFRDVTSGNNGAYPAAPGWDACTGLGVPDGAALLTVLAGAAQAASAAPH